MLGKEYTVLIFKGALYQKISPNFIFVDGTPNEDGSIITEKMDYIPYLNKDKIPWYEEEGEEEFLGDKKVYKGCDGRHDLFKYKQKEISFAKKKLYDFWNTLVVYTLCCLKTPTALECFATFVDGKGGPEPGIENMGSRKYVDICSILNNILYNSARECYKENMRSALIAAKSVLNPYNKEVYIAVSPTANWSGCKYAEVYDGKEICQILCNTDGFAAFNKADAVVTLHCTYDPKKKIYFADYDYYLTDYYNFDIADIFEHQNMLGYCKSYELYGKAHGVAVIGGNEMLSMQIPDIF